MIDNQNIEALLANTGLQLKSIARKIMDGERISPSEGIILYEKGEPGFLGMLANLVRFRKNGDYAFFNKNFHIEPTNICIYNCRFCSYRRKANDKDAWNYSISDIEDMAKSFQGKEVTEVHIVGGVHPNHSLSVYKEFVSRVKAVLPDVHVKAYSAVELDVIFKKEGVSALEGFRQLKEAGLGSIPGGGAEIFHPDIREQICPDKVDASGWLEIHRAAHQNGIPTNATMLYGHMENYEHRVDHMERLRQLQDISHGFNAFIPLKYRKANNEMSNLGEISSQEDLRNYAISRIYLDNFPHLKAYWPMIGKDMAGLSLSFGVDDIDGTIEDTTRIYTMAGAEEQKPALTVDELVTIVRKANRIPAERNSYYEIIKEY